MRILTIVVFILLFTVTGRSQVGVVATYNINNVNKEINDIANAIPYENGFEGGINYWFRLTKKRIEFFPTLYYASSRGSYDWTELGFQFKTNFYLFDFGTDCDCPTFGKQGPQLQKGFFVQLSPGVAYHRLNLPGGIPDQNNFVPTIGGAVGVDIGVSNLLTVTPLVGVRHTLGSIIDFEYTDGNGNLFDVEDRQRLTSVQLGLQATFRFDKKRY